MACVFDYLDWRGDLSFKKMPFNPVDNIILSLLAYCPFDGIVPPPGTDGSVSLRNAADRLFAAIKKNPQKMNMYHFFKDAQYRLLLAVRESVRYQDIKIAAYINHIDIHTQIQFAACTFLPEEGFPAYLAFRGTDNSIIGWKEDFNMIFTDAIPAQLEALNYIETVSKTIKGNFNAGGHSKGGNLAVYAGAFCNSKIKKRIIQIYNNDGPGFTQKMASRPEYKEIKSKIISYIPQDSIVGLLFENRDFCVVRSANSGFVQHNPFLWEVRRTDVSKLDTITEGSRFVNKALMDWLESMDNEHRQKFINALFEMLMSTNANSIPDLTSDWLKNVRMMLASLSQFDKETKKMLAKTFAMLFDIVKNNFLEDIENKYIKKGNVSKNDTLQKRKTN
ncbi:MAG: DUF2974 domain-containing protein [Spirochaetaceae bacterium]|jgi:hypothetical protein|nr:DUF2974 domain-containing protein [Spirochaetaceae bacterium]